VRESALLKNWAGILGALALSTLLTGCGMDGTGSGYAGNAKALADLSQEPLPATTWNFGQHPGVELTSNHYRIYTTLEDDLYKHLVLRVLQAAYARGMQTVPSAKVPGPLDCYVFSNRDQWEAYTKIRAGSNAPIYLQISAGGYCQMGVFAGYDIGRDQTLSVIAHEAWHQFSWFAFKDRLPSWLEEGIATQNEGIDWEGTTPVFHSENNYRRFLALKEAIRDNRLWKISDLVATHAGKVIKLPQKHIDSYYAQVWSLVLFLKSSPVYAPRLQNMLNDASAGKLTQSLAGTGVTQHEIDNFTERWNTVAGPVYMGKYISSDLPGLQREYETWAREFTASWPPKRVVLASD
jgi:hypothetical protein